MRVLLLRILRRLGLTNGMEFHVVSWDHGFMVPREETIALLEGDTLEWSAPDETGRVRPILRMESLRK